MNKKGISTSVINTAILGLVVLAVLFSAYSTLVPSAQVQGDSMNASSTCSRIGCYWNDTGADSSCYQNTSGIGETCRSGGSIPLSGLFSGTGVIFLIVMASLVILVVKGFMDKGK